VRFCLANRKKQNAFPTALQLIAVAAQLSRIKNWPIPTEIEAGVEQPIRRFPIRMSVLQHPYVRSLCSHQFLCPSGFVDDCSPPHDQKRNASGVTSKPAIRTPVRDRIVLLAEDSIRQVYFYRKRRKFLSSLANHSLITSNNKLSICGDDSWSGCIPSGTGITIQRVFPAS
jgi:hypothetical protein